MPAAGIELDVDELLSTSWYLCREDTATTCVFTGEHRGSETKEPHYRWQHGSFGLGAVRRNLWVHFIVLMNKMGLLILSSLDPPANANHAG